MSDSPAPSAGSPAPLVSLTIGGLSRTELLAALTADGVGLNESAEALLAQPEIECPVQTLELATARPVDLSLIDDAPLREVYAAAQEQGLELCPLATGPFLRLAHQEAASTDSALRRQRPPEGALHIASEILDPSFDAPKGFYLRTVEGRRWLRGYRCDDEYVVPPETTYVFARSITSR